MTTLSIVTVNLNNAPGLDSTYQSLRSQRERKFEWIVIDGGSTDGSVDNVKSYGCDVTQWISEPDAGIYDAMNKGIRLAQGSSILFLNSGDAFVDEASASLAITEFARNGSRKMVGFAADLVAQDGSKFRRKAYPAPYLFHGMPCIHQALVYPIEAARVEYDASLRCCGDYDLTVRLWRNGVGYARSQSPLVAFSLGGFSTANFEVLDEEARRIQQEQLRLPWVMRQMSSGVRRMSASELRVRRRG